MVDFSDLQKKKREVNWEYVKKIKSRPCLVTGRMHPDPHHLISVGAGGSDFTCVPLTRSMHNEVHRIGIKEFEKKHKINLWYWAFYYLKEWMDDQQAVESV